jgi:hypothetical protein
VGAIQMSQDGKSFTITYGGHELPFVGLDSSAPPAYVAGGSFPSIINALVVDKAVTAVSLGRVSDFIAANPRPADVNLGIGDLNGVPFEIYIDGGNPATLRVYSYQGIHGLGSNPILIGTFVLTANLPIGGESAGTLAYKNINGVCYFTFGGCDSIFQHNNTTATLLTSYLGGAYIGELNGRLLIFNITQTTAGPTITNYPFRVAWSAALGAYSQFNPLVGGLVTGAGFEDLPDVEDVITGFFTTGPTGFILRRQGITEITPLNNGIQPFDFNHMWSSHKGIGAINPGTVAQFGSMGIFGASTDIYSLGYDGLNSITGKAKTLLMPLVLSAFTFPPISVKATVGPIIINNNTMTAYILGPSNPSLLPPFNFFVYVFELKEWFFINATETFIPLFINFAALSLASTGVGFPVSDAFIYEIITSTQNVFFTLSATTLNANFATLVFPVEDVAFLQDISIDGIGFNVNSISGCTLTFSINGKSYGAVVVPAGRSYLKTTPSGAANSYTGLAPQLTIVSNAGGDFQLGKVVLYGTVDISQRSL